MRKRWIKWLPLFVLGFLAFIAVGGLVVRELWNWLLPPLLGARTITFWQALGVLALSRILFGGFGGGGRHSGGRRWRGMSSAERERFHEGMSGHGPGAPTMI